MVGKKAHISGDKTVGRFLADLAHEYTEWFQPEYTRSQKGEHGTVFSRIDKIWGPLSDVLDGTIQARTLGIFTGEDRLSDHVGVGGSFSLNSRPTGDGKIPRWIFLHDQYAATVDHVVAGCSCVSEAPLPNSSS